MSDDPAALPSVESVEQEFRDFLRRICEGSEEAANEFIRIYGHHILHVVRRTLPDSLRQKFDSTDFTQLVWQAVFSDPSRLTQFTTPNELIRFLSGMTVNIVGQERRRGLASAKFAVQRERPLDDPELVNDGQYCSPDLSPEQLAIAQDQLEALLRGQSERDQQILLMRYRGETCESIAETFGIHVRTVRKVIERLDPRRDTPRAPK